MAAPTSNNEVTARRLTRLLTGSDGNGGLWGKVKDKISSSINALDVSSVGGAGKYISAISETDGKISATATTMDTTPTASSTNAVTSGGVKTALDLKANDSSVVHKTGNESISDRKTFTGMVENFNTADVGYGKFVLANGGFGTRYEDWDSSLKDGAHFREWTLAFPTGANFWGRIRISFNGGYFNRNSSGWLSKSIICAFNTKNVYNNTGYYDDLGIHVEEEFRISDLIWDNTNSRWTIKIHSIAPASNNSVGAPIIEYWASGTGDRDAARQIAWVSTTPSIVTDTTYYTKRSGDASTSPTTGGVQFNWADQPVHQSPYGYEIFNRSHTIPVGNGGTGQTSLANVTVGKADTATQANYLTGFTARSGSIVWGTLTPNNGYKCVTDLQYKEGNQDTGDIAFGYKAGSDSSSYELSCQIDGFFYQRTGGKRVMDVADINSSFYAPTGAGTSGQLLKSSGSGAPTWATANAALVGITVTSTSVSDGTNTFNKYTHPTTSGNKHIPSGGSSGQFLGWDSDGTAKWVANPNTDTKNTAGSTDTSSKIFLIGATSQAANPQTYSQDTTYVDTDATLASTKVRVAEKCTLQFNTTTNALDFVFA